VVRVESGALHFEAQAGGRVAVGDQVAVSIRPESVTLGTAPEVNGHGYAGVVDDIIYTGSMRRAVVRLAPGLSVKVDSPSSRSSGLAVGQQVGLDWPRHKAFVVR
jgi:ABC-type Fe3+/spermidine/putrescine transport system ATPase subunit